MNNNIVLKDSILPNPDIDLKVKDLVSKFGLSTDLKQNFTYYCRFCFYIGKVHYESPLFGCNQIGKCRTFIKQVNHLICFLNKVYLSSFEHSYTEYNHYDFSCNHINCKITSSYFLCGTLHDYVVTEFTNHI